MAPGLKFAHQQHFIYNRYLKQVDAGLASETSMATRQKELIDGTLTGEAIPMQYPCDNAAGKDGVVTRDAAYVYTKDLPKLITSYLEHHQK
tara:strand:+ start:131 stop:403 length:273 start_codon:yes stop_codon:yes gene_type:complete